MQIPEKVISEIAALTGEGNAEVRAAFERKTNTSIRINSQKVQLPEGLQQVPWCKTGYFLEERPTFVTDPLFHGGAYYVQESSSMFLEQAIKQHVSTDEPILALDLCAAPGGKSTHIISLLPEDSVLISNEVIRTRANILSENLTKWGYPNQAIVNSDPKFIGNSELQFDLIVVDAPCSGEGLFRRSPEAIHEWSEENVELCAARQKRILADIWPVLKPGGVLIYSTCTFNHLENEQNMTWLKEQHDVESLRISFQHDSILETETNDIFGYRFLPTRSLGEGFFLSAVRKTGIGKTQTGKSRIRTVKSSPASVYLKATENLVIIDQNGQHLLTNEFLASNMETLKRLRPLQVGTPLGTTKGHDFIPAQALANSIYLRDGMPSIELDQDEALNFLSLGSLSGNYPKGWHVVRFNGVALGFIKSVGNRNNTYFPKEWRIRTDLAKYPRPFFSLGNL
ncbi:MAG: rRNA methyltransferase [Flavobacteriales bacterium]|nr:rRNA methyltransferase [Flavobacteriales bacterium]